MAQQQHIVHSIPPTYDERSRVLVLGSLPSPKSRETGYNYGHPRNRFWHVLATVAGEPTPSTNERKRDFCLRHHIALWDVVGECDIEGASDTSIRNAVANPLERIIQAAPIEAVFCTGAKAYELYRKLCEDRVGLPAVKLPSTSPANAAASFEELVDAYSQIFERTHEFEPPALDVPDVVALEQAIAADGTPLSELMDRAGTALAKRVEAILEPLGERPGKRDASRRPMAAFLCGNGNNGGDGWVAAERMASDGWPICLITAREAGDITAQPARDAAIRAAQTLEPAGIVLVDPDAATLRETLAEAAVVVDCILGTGASGKSPREPFATWIRIAVEARAHATIVAADAPSGVSAQDGTYVEPHIIADETVTMIVPKPGLRAPACGQVHVAPLAYIEPFLE